jgi:hypothetical protein
MCVECYKILELFAVANLANCKGNKLSPMSVRISVHCIVIAECAQDPALLSGNRHDMTVYSYDVN